MSANSPGSGGLPSIPAIPTSLLSKMFLGLGVASIIGFGAAGFLGWDFKRAERDTLPASVRSGPGGYRAFYFWHGSFLPGK